MKKILLFALPLLAMCFASCEKDKGNNGEEEWIDDSPIIQFKDPKFLQALLVVKENTYIYDAETDDYNIPYPDVDKNNDGQISEKEASVVKGLLIEEAGIRNLEEIKYFTSLTNLYCSSNELTSLDLSKNTALAGLNCSGNDLTSLDVSNNTALESLDCSGNDLTSLDVSNNTALTSLNCRSNDLTSLDVSNNTSLEYLECSYNQLTSLDVSNNTALTDLQCGYNELTSLDVSNNTALTDLYCSFNQLTSLDVSNNTALKSLDCFRNPFTKITLYKYHMIFGFSIQPIEEEYGNIIEYVE